MSVYSFVLLPSSMRGSKNIAIRDRSPAVAAALLDGVKRRVRHADDLMPRHGLGLAARERPRGDADRAGARDGAAVGEREAVGLDGGAGLFRQLAAAGAVDEADDDEELLAAPADDRVPRAETGAENLRDLHQHGVAGLVAVRVVHALEVIEVDEKEDQVLPLGARGDGQT